MHCPRGALCRRCSENFSRFSDKHMKQSFGGVLSKDVLKILQSSQKNIIAGASFLTNFQVGNLKLAEVAICKTRCS